MKKNKSFKIKGKVAFQSIGPGFWAIIGNDKKEWRPTNFPEQLKHENHSVEVSVVEVDDMSIFMWGTAVKITSFETMNS